MADYRAITTLCDAIIRLLKSCYLPQNFGGNKLDLQIGILQDKPLVSCVTLCVYRIFPNINTRTPSGRLKPDGSRLKSRLPLDLHFLLTSWGSSPSQQLSVVGWMMRVLEDNPILPASALNPLGVEIYRQDEAVEITLAELSNDDLFRIWEKLTDLPYEISVPYVARNVRIESLQEAVPADIVTERVFSDGATDANG